MAAGSDACKVLAPPPEPARAGEPGPVDDVPPSIRCMCCHHALRRQRLAQAASATTPPATPASPAAAAAPAPTPQTACSTDGGPCWTSFNIKTAHLSATTPFVATGRPGSCCRATGRRGVGPLAASQQSITSRRTYLPFGGPACTLVALTTHRCRSISDPRAPPILASCISRVATLSAMEPSTPDATVTRTLPLPLALADIVDPLLPDRGLPHPPSAPILDAGGRPLADEPPAPP